MVKARGRNAQIELEEDIESDKAQDSMSKIEPLRESIIPFSELETFCRPDEKTTTELGYLSERGQEINREPLPLVKVKVIMIISQSL